MEVTLNLEYRQVLDMVRQLPANQIEKIKKELTENFIQTKARSEVFDFQEFILSGPVMSDYQYQIFNEQREQFNSWRTL
jgi:maltose-binding protein MalE